MDYIPPGSSVHGILQARILEWVAILFSRGSSQPRDRTHVTCVGRQILYHQASREASLPMYSFIILLSHPNVHFQAIHVTNPYIYPSVYPPAHTSIHPSTGHKSIYLFISIHLLLHLLIQLATHLCIQPASLPSIHLLTCHFSFFPICPFNHILLSIYLFIHLYSSHSFTCLSSYGSMHYPPVHSSIFPV